MGVDPIKNIDLKNYLSAYRFDEFVDMERSKSMPIFTRSGRISCHELYSKGNKASSKRTSFVVHGYFDHTAWMTSLIQRLLERGDRVIAMDLPGHGLSEGVRGQIDDFADYARAFQGVYDYFFRPQEEIFYYGHSTGSTPWIHWALLGEQDLGSLPNFSEVHLMAPLIRVAAHRFTWVPFLYQGISKNEYFPRKKNFRALRDPLANDYIHTDWLRANLSWSKKLAKEAKVRKDIKVYLWSGNVDVTVLWPYNLRLLKSRLDYRLKIFNGLGHRIVDTPHAIDLIIESSSGPGQLQSA